MPEECNFQCKQNEDFKQLLLFQGKVAASLKNIEKDIKEMKDNDKADDKELWDAINRIRDDIKSLYWKVGFISGGSALLISIAVRMFDR